MTNLEYFQNEPIEFVHAALNGLMESDNTLFYEQQPTVSLKNWLNSEFDEQVLKEKLLKYCERMDRTNQTLAEAYGVSGKHERVKKIDLSWL